MKISDFIGIIIKWYIYDIYYKLESLLINLETLGEYGRGLE